MKVVAIPRNGLGNRLQMLASCKTLATELNADFEIVWDTQEIFTSSFSAIFQSIDNTKIIDPVAIQQVIPFETPDFTNYDPENNIITLKNLRIGDQAFMPKLRRLIVSANSSTSIAVISGEKFLLSQKPSFKDSRDFRGMRQSFYKNIQFSDSVKLLVNERLSTLGRNFWSVHLRATDRSAEALSLGRITDAILVHNNSLNLKNDSVYIASDDQERGLQLSSALTDQGFKVVFIPEINRNRLSNHEALDSAVDWILLSKARQVFSYGSTTYSYEASVAVGTFESRVDLTEGKIHQAKRAVQKEALDFKLYGKLPTTTVFLGKRKK